MLSLASKSATPARGDQRDEKGQGGGIFFDQLEGRSDRVGNLLLGMELRYETSEPALYARLALATTYRSAGCHSPGRRGEVPMPV
jgi:hypothetical protein